MRQAHVDGNRRLPPPYQYGTNLGFTLEAVPGIRTVAAGTLDDPSRISADKQPFRLVFTRSKP
jgi:hypothetical protein